jgi:putative addiction module killer protein
MFTVQKTDDFAAWLDGLKDVATRARLIRRLQKAEQGLLGDVAPVGAGVSEMREHFGAGWRMYYVRRGLTLVVMLGGGDKSTQAKDIEAAKKLAATLFPPAAPKRK